MSGRRRLRFLALVVLVVGGLASPAVIPRAAAAGAPAARVRARAAAVTSGDARFEVLSPTLIRTEYAGDRRFTDAATFNAIGRADFAPTHFTARAAGGWLTIQTPAMTLRYQVGSGPFGARNLQVTERAGPQPVTAGPGGEQVRVPSGVVEQAQRRGGLAFHLHQDGLGEGVEGLVHDGVGAVAQLGFIRGRRRYARRARLASLEHRAA